MPSTSIHGNLSLGKNGKDTSCMAGTMFPMPMLPEYLFSFIIQEKSMFVGSQTISSTDHTLLFPYRDVLMGL